MPGAGTGLPGPGERERGAGTGLPGPGGKGSAGVGAAPLACATMVQRSSTPFQPVGKLLVANRGEIARRIIRTARAMGIATVAVFSDPDQHSLHVSEADEAVRLPGASASDTYLRSDRIIDAARRTRADAVHPGYGFLAESAPFARAVAEAGITFVGPPAAAIEAMGSKIAAKEAMSRAGVPTLSSRDVTGLSNGALDEAGREIGYPLLVKASFGGGGRGMRIVREPGELTGAVESAAREAMSAFGDGTVFLERFVSSPRHIEVQIFGDSYGSVIHLFERECSIQRRHQKIIEESPSPAVGEQMRARLATIATAAAQAVGYLGAGTVEMLMGGRGDPGEAGAAAGGGDPDRDSREDPVYFLEMNTRLQVEHPVTELVTGLDLVRLQILVAQGEPLPPAALHPAMRGHAIEARLYAEDPEHDWRPSTGTLQLFEIGASPGVRVDSGVHSGIAVSPYYDPMLAKVICHAPSRAEAAATLAATLRRARIHGVVTNRDLLVRILGHEEFLAGATDTGFLERHDPATLGSALVDGPACALHAWAAVLAVQAENRQAARVLGGIPSGWRNNPSEPQSRHLRFGDRDIVVDYRFGRDGVTVVDVAIDGAPRPDVSVVSVSPSSVVLDDGVRRSFAVRRSGDRVFVDSALGATDFVLDDRFPSTRNGPGAGSLIAPLPGEVVRLHVASGDAVAAGDPLVVIEAMKMEHTVGAQADGTVTQVLVAVGAQVEAGAVLAVVEGAGSGGGEAP